MGQMPRRPKVAIIILMICSAVYISRGIHDERTLLRSLDFKTLFGCARCMTHGCDAYKSDDVYQAYIDGGGEPGKDIPAFRPHEPVYPPSALALMTPFTLFRWQTADRVWLCLSTGCFLLGVWLIASLAMRDAPIMTASGVGLLLLGSTMAFMLAQPAQLISGLCAITVWCFLEKRFQFVGVLCLSVALAFKPHVAGLLWLFFLLSRTHRKQAWRVLFTAVIVCLPGFIWTSTMNASAHWLSEMQTNIQVLSQVGATNDPGPFNHISDNVIGLQSLISFIRDEPRFYIPVAYAIGAVLLLAWLIAFLRSRPSRNNDYLALASILLISMLPVYHRDYDLGLLILIFPAAAALAKSGGRRGQVVAVLSVLAMVPIGHNFALWINHFLVHPRYPHLGVIGTIFWLRSATWAVAALSLIYLACFYWFSQRDAAGEAISAAI